MTTLRYPSELTINSNTDYIEFHAVRKRYGELARTGETKYDYHPTRIILNVPQKVVENHSQNWNNAALGELTPELLGTTINNVSNLFGDGFTAAENLNEALRNALGLGEGFLLRRGLELAAKGMGSLGASGITDNGILSAAGGIVFNPNLEVLYEGPDFRTFQFQFVMFNKSKEDARSIYEIVEWFRDISVPSKAHRSWSTAGSLFTQTKTPQGLEIEEEARQDLIDQSSQYFIGNSSGTQITFPDNGEFDRKAGWTFSTKSRFLEQPPLLLMTYKRGGNDHPFMRPLLPAAINNISIDYTPTGNYTVMNNFDDSDKATTVAANITIQITERTNLTGEDLLEFKKSALSRGSSKEYRAPKG